MTNITVNVTDDDVKKINSQTMSLDKITAIRDKVLADHFPGLNVEFSDLSRLAERVSAGAQDKVYDLFHTMVVKGLNEWNKIVWVQHDCAGFPHWFGYGPNNTRYAATKFLTNSALKDKFILFRSEPLPTSRLMGKYERYTVLLNSDVKKFIAQKGADKVAAADCKISHEFESTNEDGDEIVRDLTWSTDTVLCYTREHQYTPAAVGVYNDLAAVQAAVHEDWATITNPEKIVWFEHFEGPRERDFLLGELSPLNRAEHCYMIEAETTGTFKVFKRVRAENKIVETLATDASNLLEAMDLCERHHQKEINKSNANCER